MGKGRRLTTSRSERFLGSFGSGDGGGSAESELMEEDVWSVVEDDAADQLERDSVGAWIERSDVGSRGGYGTEMGWKRNGRHVSGLTVAVGDCSLRTSRIVYSFRGNDGGHGGSSAAPSPCVGGRGHMATSAPVNVPDWSKILRVHSVDSLYDDSDVDVAGLERGSEMVPPHEYLARCRKGGGASVFFGVGRTLKGRDMRRVRDAVWSQTGFAG